MLPTKFGVQEKKRKIDFQDGDHGGHLGFPIRTILVIFLSKSHPDDSYQVPSQLAQVCRRSRLLKQLLTPHDGRRTMSTSCSGELINTRCWDPACVADKFQSTTPPHPLGVLYIFVPDVSRRDLRLSVRQSVNTMRWVACGCNSSYSF